jgi:hypothetical protein
LSDLTIANFGRFGLPANSHWIDTPELPDSTRRLAQIEVPLVDVTDAAVLGRKVALPAFEYRVFHIV